MKKIFLVFLLILSVSSYRALAQCMVYPVSMQEKVTMSNVIVEGKVISKYSFWNSNQDFIYTSNVIQIYKIFKGTVVSNQIEIISEGGIIGNTKIKAEPSLELNINDVGVFFVVGSSILNPNSTLPVSQQFIGYAANQSIITYDLKAKSAFDPFNVYNDVDVEIYQTISNYTGQPYQDLVSFNINQQPQSVSGMPGLMALPIITGISASAPAGTFTTVTITGSNFGPGPFGGTRALEFRDANNGGAGFIPTPANHIISWADNTIQAMVPTQSGSGNIRITNNTSETTISGVTISIPYNESNVVSGGTYYQPDLINDNGIGGYNFAYNTTFNGSAVAVAAFERALQTWRCGTFVNFNKVGTSAIACQALDNTNLVTFDGSCALPAGVLGVSYSYYAGCAGNVWYLNENDLKFRTNGTGGINWNYGPAATAGGLFDFESVCLHELGHSHQLGHTILPVTVMNYAVGPNTDRRTLTPASETTGGNDIMGRSVINNSCGPTAMVALNGSNCSINAPIADFSGTPLTGCNSLVVNFTDLSTGTPTSWNWSFPLGAPNTFVGQNPPAITYAAPGNYTVTLVVTNASGNDTETKTNYIVVNNCPPPVADFSANPTSVCSGQSVSFLDLSTNSPTSWSWTFPGGTPATSVAQNPTILYGTPGVYNVTLTATNPYGSGSITKNGYITINNCPLPPVANFSGAPTSLCAGGTVNFTDLSTNSPNSWQWTFTGGTPSTSILQNPSITYNTAGTYAVSLTVGNISGTNTKTVSGYITVNVCSAPVVSFVGWPTSVCAGSNVTFQDQSTNSPTSWSWTFPGGTPALTNVQNPVITYSVAGVYNVTLQAFNAFGNNTTTINSYITVTSCPLFGSGLIVNDGSLIQIESGALVTVEGGFINRDNGANIGRIDNWGLFTLTGDWTNNSSGNAFINSSPGTTELMGAAQTITGSTTTNYYNLTLSGSGVKTLNINTVTEGTLALTTRELATQNNWMRVTNSSPLAITRTGPMNSTPVQGFVSSTGAGRLIWNTNSVSQYVFPVGSSLGSPRFRPVGLRPVNAAANTYAVRFVNNDPTIDGFSVFLKDPNIGNINPYWYQKINGLSGTTNPDITLYFDNIADNIAPLPNLIMAQWAYNAPPVQWRAISGVTVAGGASPILSAVTKAAWISFNTENFDLAPQSISLPVELISFTGTCNKHQIEINWITASEISNDYFILESSTDGINYHELTKIDGAGTTNNTSEYHFTDNTSNANLPLYYRLTQYDLDGKSSEPKIINVKCSNTSQTGTTINMYPNPIKGELNVVVEQPVSGKVKVDVVNVLGQVVFSKEFTLMAGYQQIKLDLEYLAPAMYNVIVENNSLRVVEKLVKQY